MHVSIDCTCAQTEPHGHRHLHATHVTPGPTCLLPDLHVL